MYYDLLYNGTENMYHDLSYNDSNPFPSVCRPRVQNPVDREEPAAVR
jgi:hypothetical protein